MEVEQSGTVKRPSEHEQSSVAHEAEKMRVDDDEMAHLTVVRDELAVSEEPQISIIHFGQFRCCGCSGKHSRTSWSLREATQMVKLE